MVQLSHPCMTIGKTIGLTIYTFVSKITPLFFNMLSGFVIAFLKRPHWVCPCSQRVCFPHLHCLGSRLLCRELSEAGPGLYPLPRSKPLRLRYSGSPQRCRLGWACVLCPSQVQAAQVTRCLASAVAATYRLPRPCRSVFWVYNGLTFSGRC